MLPALVHVALTQGLLDPAENIRVELQPLEGRSEFRLQHLLADIRFGAFALVARAVVVDVFALLQLPDQAAAAVAAADKAREGEVVLLLLTPPAEPLLKYILHLLPQLGRNDRCVRAAVRFAIEVKIARVDPVVQNLVNRRLDR